MLAVEPKISDAQLKISAPGLMISATARRVSVAEIKIRRPELKISAMKTQDPSS